MNIGEDKVYKAVKNIFENIKDLKELDSSFTWENLTGDFGEYIVFFLKRLPMSKHTQYHRNLCEPLKYIHIYKPLII